MTDKIGDPGAHREAVVDAVGQRGGRNEGDRVAGHGAVADHRLGGVEAGQGQTVGFGQAAVEDRLGEEHQHQAVGVDTLAAVGRVGLEDLRRGDIDKEQPAGSRPTAVELAHPGDDRKRALIGRPWKVN